MALKLSELIAAYGDDLVQLQNLDQCTISLDYSAKKGTKITFGTEQPFSANGTEKLGLVVWLDRERAEEIVAESRRSSEGDA